MADELLAALGGQQQAPTSAPDSFIQQPEDKRELAKKVEKDCAKSGPKVAAYRQEAEVAEKAYDGWQWDELDRMKLEQLRRPTLVFNEIKPTINAISGIERLNRADVRFVSRPIDSNPIEDLAGDLASEAYATVLDLSDGDSERSRAIKDMSICGMGWYEIRMDYELEPDGKIMLDRLPWREMGWDTGSKKENIGDSRFRYRKREVPRGEFKKRWPKFIDMVDVGAPEYPEMSVGKYELVTPYYSIENERANPQVGEQGVVKDSIPVIQYQWMDTAVVYRYADPSAQGGIREMRESEWLSLKRKLALVGGQGPQAVRQNRTVYKQVWVARGVVIEGPTELPGGFGLKCITGEWDEHKKCWYGIVRPLLDPQRTMNKSISSALTMFLTNSKGGIMFETGAFADPSMAKRHWSRSDAFIELNEGGAQKIVQRQPVDYKATVDLFFNEAKAAMNYVSGIPQDMLGVAVQDSGAPAISKRVQAALSVLGWYFDNITRARKDEARTVLEYIRNYWSQGQLIRIGGMANSKAIPLLKSNLPMAYDLMLDDSVRHNPNLKAQIWQDMQPLIPALLKFGLGRFLLQILKYSPMPAQLVQEMQREAAQMAQQPQQNQQQKGKQQSPEEVAAKVKKMSAETERTLAEARKIDQEIDMATVNTTLEAFWKHKELKQKDALQEHREVMDTMKAIKMMLDPVLGHGQKEADIAQRQHASALGHHQKMADIASRMHIASQQANNTSQGD